jgi:hypothetical protein
MMMHSKKDIKDRCDVLIRALVGSDELAEMWWVTQNQAFEYKTPQELFDGAEAGRVYDYLMHHAFVGGGS